VQRRVSAAAGGGVSCHASCGAELFRAAPCWAQRRSSSSPEAAVALISMLAVAARRPGGRRSSRTKGTQFRHRRWRIVTRCTSSSGDGDVHVLLQSYDPSKFREYFIVRPLAIIARCATIARLGGTWLLDFRITGKDASEARRLARELRKICTELGPSFVKLGQVLSSRVDLLPEEYVQELKTLTDNVLPFPADTARRILDLEWRGRETPFDPSDLPDEPTAAASLGQVYRVSTTDGDLAVKVQRPGVREQICLDLFILRSFAPWIRRTFRLNTDLAGLVDEYGLRFIQELDYLQEASNAEEFEAAIHEIGLNSVCIAEPVRSLTTGRVLVTRWVAGDRIDNNRGPEGARLCGLAMTAYLTMLLETGRLHADPHPGNMICTPDGKLCILDWGLVTDVMPNQQKAIVSYITHLLAEEYAAVPGDLVQLGFIAESGKAAIEDEAVAKAISKVFRGLASGGAARRRVRDVIPEIQEVRRRYGNIGQIPAYFTYILRAFTVLEGVGLDQNPSYAIVNDCYPYLISWLLRRTDRSGQKVLEALLYKSDGSDSKGARPPVSAKRILRLMEALETYVRQAAAARSHTSESHRQSQRVLLKWLGSSPAVKDLVIFEAARTLDVLFREALEMITPPGGPHFAPPRTTEDVMVMASLLEFMEGLVETQASGSAPMDLPIFSAEEAANWLSSLSYSELAPVLQDFIDTAPSRLASALLRFNAALLERAEARGRPAASGSN